MIDDFDQFKVVFFTECAELLAELEAGLASLEAGTADEDCLHAIFRAVHSIKAGAGAFKFAELVEFSHAFEALLDELRDGRVPLTPSGVATLFRANDMLSDLVSAAQSETPLASGFGADVIEEITALHRIVDRAPTPHSDARPITAPAIGDTPPSPAKFCIEFVPSSRLFQHANEPLLLLRELGTLGDLEVAVDLTRLPPDLAQLCPEDAYFAWRILLTTKVGKADIEDVFEFVADDCHLEIEPVDPNISIGDIASDLPTVAEPLAQAEMADGDPIIPADAFHPKELTSATKSPIASKAGKISSIRVDLDRVDKLVNMVGELVIAQSMLSQQTAELPRDQFPAIARGLDELALHTRELQENVMAIRMQPVSSVFTRMPRLVRELAGKLGRQVQLQTTGENTEVDKTVIEEITDPITHMIRNAIDHGFEDPAVRQANGKPAVGTILLSAEHRGGRIVITIKDDGAGIDRDLVLSKARERNLISAEAALTDNEIDNLIFAPGFSTADVVTDVSGRGVGMDVVKKNIQRLGGRVSIRSKRGEGTIFTMTLPLTLAVADGMIAIVADEKFVIPIANILESFRPRRRDIHRLPNGQDLVTVRGDYVPLIRLCKAFSLDDGETDPTKGIVVLVETEGNGNVGILVDRLSGQQQVVIKSLESNYDPVAGISAVTILGNGMVAPIVDIDGLCHMPGVSVFSGHRRHRGSPIFSDTEKTPPSGREGSSARQQISLEGSGPWT